MKLASVKSARRPRAGRMARSVALALAAVLLLAPAAAHAHADALADEPLIPGLDIATDFEVAPDGDVYVAQQSGELLRYDRLASSTTAHPRYDLRPQLIYTFAVTRQTDRGLVGITLDHDFAGTHRYVYALITRGSSQYVEQAANGNPNGIRRTSQLIRIAIPPSGPAAPADLTPILGRDVIADPDATCKPYQQGQAAAHGETDAPPNGVTNFTNSNGTVDPNLTDAHLYPDGDLLTRADGAYDCIASDSTTHGPGDVVSLADGSLFVSFGDASPFEANAAASLRSNNLESYAGKVVRIDRSGNGVAGHAFCPTETDLTRICTKIWAMGMRNPFRITALPPDPTSGGEPVLAVGNVGNGAVEALAIAHKGDNLGWPCWEGTYWNYWYADGRQSAAIRSAWGGPGLIPIGGGSSCDRLAANPGGDPIVPAPGVIKPAIDYPHDPKPEIKGISAAVVAGPRIETVPNADPKVALPASWAGSLIFGDYARGWLQRLSPDAQDPANADADGGLVLPADSGRAPTVVTEPLLAEQPLDPVLDQIADAPPPGLPGQYPWFRLTTREGPDGALWYLRFGSASQNGGLYRLRTPAVAAALIENVTGDCTTGGDITLTAADAGAGATYSWDLDGDGVDDPGRTARTTTITPTQLAALRTGTGWIRLFVRSAGDESVATRYICNRRPPTITFTEPADQAQVVLGQPITIRASRPAGDATDTGIPDAELRWVAETLHGGDHVHSLVDRTGGTETVGGQQRLQITLTPDAGHELGSFTRVRLYSPAADVGGTPLTLVPKPVTIAFASQPAGARISIQRDRGTDSIAAPGNDTLAAGYLTSIAAEPSITVGGATWYFAGWSDGEANVSRPWSVPANDGAAPVAKYGIAPTPPPTPAPTPTPTPAPTATPAPGATPEPAAGPTPTPAPGGTLVQPGPLPVLPAALTVADVRAAAVLLSPSTGAGGAAIRGRLRFARDIVGDGITMKVALRARDCRWWAFGAKRFAGRGRAARRARTTVCVQPPSWRAVRLTWSAREAAFAIDLGGDLRPGRYALRLRFQRGTTVIAGRVAAAVVR